MDKFVKYQSQQGGNFTVNQNLVDFVLPAGQVYNLHDSYINLNCVVDVVEKETDSGVGVYPMNLKWKHNNAVKNNHFDNVAVVKNAHMNSGRKGQIENIRRVDILRQNLKNYERNQRELNAGIDHKNASCVASPIQDNQSGIFREFNKVQNNGVGAVKSRDLTILPIQIPLNQIFDFCNTKEFDCGFDKAGESRIHLELNVDKLDVEQSEQIVSASFQKCEDVSTTGDIDQLVTDYTVDSLREVLFWVGQKLACQGTSVNMTWNHTTDGVNYGVVSQLEWVEDSTSPNYRKVIISFEDKLGTLASGSLTDVKVSQASITSGSFSLTEAEIVLKEVASPAGMESITYNRFSTEETNGNSLTNFQRQFQVEAGATNLFVFFPSAVDGLNSVNTDIVDFRLRINNEDATNRVVDKYSPLYYDRISMTMTNASLPLRNLQEHVPDVSKLDYDDLYADGDLRLVSIMNPTPMTPIEKLVQVNIDAGGGGVKEMALFKQIPSVMVY